MTLLARNAGPAMADQLQDAVIPRVSLGLIALGAAVVLVYISGSFLLAEVYGVKRVLEIGLTLLVFVGAVRYGIRMRVGMIDPLIAFVALMVGTEILIRGELLYVIDGVSTLFAIVVIYSVPVETFWKGARLLAWMAAILAAMALLQWVLLFISPELGAFRLIVSKEGVIENSVKHPIALLGLFGEQQYTFFGTPVARLQSFALEPSLNVVYFMIPASLAMLTASRRYFVMGVVGLLFCVLSLSGSVFVALAFTFIWWLLLHIVSIRFAFSYGLLLALGGYIFALQRLGLDSMIAGAMYLSQYGDYLGKSTSLSVRGSSATENLAAALGQPFGSATLSDMAGPWLINASLVAGWLGALLIFLTLRNLGASVQKMNVGQPLFSATRLGTLFLLGALSTIVVFNDYQMSHYAGIVMLAIVIRAVRCRNDALAGTADADAHAAASAG